jgi:hypothetical protein
MRVANRSSAAMKWRSRGHSAAPLPDIVALSGNGRAQKKTPGWPGDCFSK